MLVDESVDLDPDCRLKVAVGLSRCRPHIEYTNTALSTMPMLAQPFLRYGRGVRGAGGGCLYYVELPAESHRRVQLASLYHCGESGCPPVSATITSCLGMPCAAPTPTAGRRQMMSKQHNWYHLIACSATSTVVVNCALNSFGQQRTSKATAIDKGGGSSTAARSFW